ncbi:hypothetical protein HPP92_023175 [Vanilla planifolia]|uniref:Uncharacterized protein n=1 Tax=Vanilla planifolia TaxID=51239 RepID=A0A835PVF8_VANPL|nr:hypothetical protein HPP92_023496 [Vanilla planifolia]KAG0460047.1 hypothetical protein HPP92_023175 [Vanilla planifolia]
MGRVLKEMGPAKKGLKQLNEMFARDGTARVKLHEGKLRRKRFKFKSKRKRKRYPSKKFKYEKESFLQNQILLESISGLKIEISEVEGIRNVQANLKARNALLENKLVTLEKEKELSFTQVLGRVGDQFFLQGPTLANRRHANNLNKRSMTGITNEAFKFKLLVLSRHLMDLSEELHALRQEKNAMEEENNVLLRGYDIRASTYLNELKIETNMRLKIVDTETKRLKDSFFVGKATKSDLCISSKRDAQGGVTLRNTFAFVFSKIIDDLKSREWKLEAIWNAFPLFMSLDDGVAAIEKQAHQLAKLDEEQIGPTCWDRMTRDRRLPAEISGDHRSRIADTRIALRRNRESTYGMPAVADAKAGEVVIVKVDTT